MPDNKSQEQMLQETYDKVNQIWGAFFGTKNTSNNGLLGDFKEHRRHDAEFRADYYKFKRFVIAVFAFMAGSGVLGVSIFQLVGG